MLTEFLLPKKLPSFIYYFYFSVLFQVDTISNKIHLPFIMSVGPQWIHVFLNCIITGFHNINFVAHT